MTMTVDKQNCDFHRQLCNDLNQLYAAKNADYGDSFHETFLDEGWAMVRIRLGDKYRRICELTRRSTQKVADESLRDTLIDLANYALMAVMELDREKKAGAKVASPFVEVPNETITRTPSNQESQN